MSEYKRLTDKEHGYKKCASCSYRNCQYCDDIYEIKEQAHTRLVELEDKIENGTLIELPCKVGDTVYFIEYFCKANGCSNETQAFCCGCREMIERKHKKQTYVISKKKFKLEDLSKINKKLYITKEAAEARLKELQEGK